VEGFMKDPRTYSTRVLYKLRPRIDCTEHWILPGEDTDCTAIEGQAVERNVERSATWKRRHWRFMLHKKQNRKLKGTDPALCCAYSIGRYCTYSQRESIGSRNPNENQQSTSSDCLQAQEKSFESAKKEEILYCLRSPLPPCSSNS